MLRSRAPKTRYPLLSDSSIPIILSATITSLYQSMLIFSPTNAMIGKSVILLSFLVGFLVTLSLFIGSIDFREHVYQFLQQPLPLPSPPQIPPASSSQLPCRSLAPLKVYMYDLPRRFNIGMLNRRSSDADDLPVTGKTLPPWPKRSGLKSQHSVEYWMMASLLYDGSGGAGDEEREAVRVSDPEIADVFFLPFFSSLSFNTHGHFMTDPETEVDKQLQVTFSLLQCANCSFSDSALIPLSI